MLWWAVPLLAVEYLVLGLMVARLIVEASKWDHGPLYAFVGRRPRLVVAAITLLWPLGVLWALADGAASMARWLVGVFREGA